MFVCALKKISIHSLNLRCKETVCVCACVRACVCVCVSESENKQARYVRMKYDHGETSCSKQKWRTRVRANPRRANPDCFGHPAPQPTAFSSQEKIIFHEDGKCSAAILIRLKHSGRSARHLSAAVQNSTVLLKRNSYVNTVKEAAPYL